MTQNVNVTCGCHTRALSLGDVLGLLMTKLNTKTSLQGTRMYQHEASLSVMIFPILFVMLKLLRSNQMPAWRSIID